MEKCFRIKHNEKTASFQGNVSVHIKTQNRPVSGTVMLLQTYTKTKNGAYILTNVS